VSRAARSSPVRPHAFVLDPEVSAADFHERSWCARCQLPGEVGDERHPAGARPPITVEEAREFDRRRLGEHDEGEDE